MSVCNVLSSPPIFEGLCLSVCNILSSPPNQPSAKRDVQNTPKLYSGHSNPVSALPAVSQLWPSDDDEEEEADDQEDGEEEEEHDDDDEKEDVEEEMWLKKRLEREEMV